jgi:pyrroline-5-carboxylate reductase
MPNIGALKATSTTALCLGAGCVAARDLPRLRRVFQSVGVVRDVVDENALHAITAVGASGPAFVLVAVEALVDAGVEAGLPRVEALAWARGALTAAAARLDDGIEPQAIRALVTSPAGTTAAGLAKLEEHGVRAAFLAAGRAAVARSRELA